MQPSLMTDVQSRTIFSELEQTVVNRLRFNLDVLHICLQIATWNCRGLHNSIPYIRHMSSMGVELQEHWLGLLSWMSLIQLIPITCQNCIVSVQCVENDRKDRHGTISTYLESYQSSILGHWVPSLKNWGSGLKEGPKSHMAFKKST